jgi:hypothetical protein
VPVAGRRRDEEHRLPLDERAVSLGDCVELLAHTPIVLRTAIPPEIGSSA